MNFRYSTILKPMFYLYDDDWGDEGESGSKYGFLMNDDLFCFQKKDARHICINRLFQGVYYE